MSQASLYSSDLIMLFFFITSLNALINNKNIILGLSLTGMLFSHTRGIQLCVVVWAYDMFRKREGLNFSIIIKESLKYLPAITIAASWYLFHYISKGWIFYHENSPWVECYERVNINGFIRNMGIAIWRLIDFGRIFLWGTVLFMLFYFKKAKKKTDRKFKELLFLFIASSIIILPSMIIYKIMNSHRYLMPVYFFLPLITVSLLNITNTPRITKVLLIAFLTAGLISGNFWVYPQKIATGWDASLSYLPYQHLRSLMIDYIEEQNIPFSQIGTEVPNTTVFKFIDAGNDERSFERANVKRHKYIFYSNIMNMFSDEVIDQLNSEWIIIKEYRFLQVYVILFKNPEFNSQESVEKLIQTK